MGSEVTEAGNAVKALLQGATPARKKEIEDPCDRNAPEVCVVEDARGVNISAGKGRIQFAQDTRCNLAARLQWVPYVSTSFRTESVIFHP